MLVYKFYSTLPGIISGYASHYTRYRQKANAFYNNETVEWGYEGIHSSELYTQRAVEIIKNHNKNVVSKLSIFLVDLNLNYFPRSLTAIKKTNLIHSSVDKCCMGL